MFARHLLAAVAILGFTAPAEAQPLGEKFGCVHTQDVIYGRRADLALTMDVFTPKGKLNGAGIIVVVSADYKSGRFLLNLAMPEVAPKLLERGYVVFAVMHGSQPTFTVPEIVEDMHKAVHFIKDNAKKYGVDPKRLGIAGASSGGHLSLMMGCACKGGGVKEKESGVAAVACFFPPTDFLEFDKPDLPDEWKAYRTLFDVRLPDPDTKQLERITAAKRTELGRTYSPLYRATKESPPPPTFIIHGDADKLVPLGQSKKMIAKLKECGAVCDIDIKKGMGHDFVEAVKHMPQFAKWFDEHLAEK